MCSMLMLSTDHLYHNARQRTGLSIDTSFGSDHTKAIEASVSNITMCPSTQNRNFSVTAAGIRSFIKTAESFTRIVFHMKRHATPHADNVRIICVLRLNFRCDDSDTHKTIKHEKDILLAINLHLQRSRFAVTDIYRRQCSDSLTLHLH